MPLPDEYLHYAWRRHGMDHDRYDWTMQPERKPVAWPGGARIALWVVPALEFFPLDQPAQPFKAPGGMVTPYPDLRHYTLRDYGNRVGVFRVFKVLDRLGIKASVAVNSKVAERYPFLIEEVNRRGWEIIAYGVDMGRLHYGGLPVEDETAQIKEAVGSLRRVSGQAITGWLSPAKAAGNPTWRRCWAGSYRWALNAARISAPVADHTPSWPVMWRSAFSQKPMRCGWPEIQG